MRATLIRHTVVASFACGRQPGSLISRIPDDDRPEYRTRDLATSRDHIRLTLAPRLLKCTAMGAAMSLRLDEIGAAMAVLDRDGLVVDATPPAIELFTRFALPLTCSSPLPGELADELSRAPLGEAIVWRRTDADAVLGCTRYRLGHDHVLVLIREITEQQRALSRRLHRQRLEATGRLVAHIAHDLRAPLSSIVYNADVLAKRAHEMPAGTAELLHETQLAADQLRRTIAGLLDFVRVGPPVTETLELRELVDRVASLLRSAFRAGHHELTVALHDGHVCVCGNPIAIEQILVNLLVNATESAGGAPVRIRVTSEHVAARRDPSRPWRALDEMVLIRVADDGPGIPPDRRRAVFEPFVTSKADGTGLGLTLASEAAASLGGHLALEDSAVGASFALVLPLAEVPS
jgi:signal transduction histidine kinase